MKNLYTIFAIGYAFIVLTSYAVNDLFGMNKGVFGMIGIFAILYVIDIYIERYLHYKSGDFSISQLDRIKLTLFAAGIWTGLEILFLAIDILVRNPSVFIDNLSNIFHPMFFVSGFMIGIAVYSSLGYGQNRRETVDQPVEIMSENETDIYLKNRETQINIADAIKHEKQRIKDE